MDDFRTQLTEAVDPILTLEIEPVFVVIDLFGAEYIKSQHGAESLAKFHEATVDAVPSSSRGGTAISYGEGRVIGVLPGYDRLKTFALIERLRRALPMLAQSFDCILQPEFDVLEYDPGTGIAGVMAQLVTRPLLPTREAA